ncbi:MAG: methionyl-tRNA formyltransferase [Candidatus Eisenbacteria bacterium]
MRVLFFGTPDFARVVLSHLVDSPHEVVGCVSQPPRPSGRGLKLVDPPAARLAMDAVIPVFQPEKLHSAGSLERFRELKADLFVTAAFGRLLRPSILGMPPRGCWNVHTSLLPRHRGASPATSALLAGDLWTGVSIFELDEGMDTGPLLAQAMIPIGPQETAGELTERLADLGGRTLVDTITREAESPLPRRPQLDELATYARLLSKDDGHVAWNRPSLQVDRQIRAVTPWPGAFTFLDGKRVRIHRATPLHEMVEPSEPGTVVGVGNAIDVACGQGAIRLFELQTEGKTRQSAEEWARGARLATGVRFDG